MTDLDPAANEAPIKVLLVDDHQITRVGLKSLLERFNDIMVIDEAENGARAIQLCAQHRPTVVLMDVRMPVMNGVDATREIKQLDANHKVLMLTSADDDDEVFSAFAAGADGYCLKQVAGDQLRLAILSVSQGSAWIDPALAKRVLMNINAPAKAEKIDVQTDKKKTSGKFALTSRELQVLKLITDGMSNAGIAAELVVSLETVKTHVRHIMEKLVVADRTQAAVKALKEGLLS